MLDYRSVYTILAKPNDFEDLWSFIPFKLRFCVFLRSGKLVLLNHWVFYLRFLIRTFNTNNKAIVPCGLLTGKWRFISESPIFPNHPSPNSLGTSLPNLLDFISSLTVTAKKGTRSAFHKHNRGHRSSTTPLIPAMRRHLFVQGAVWVHGCQPPQLGLSLESQKFRLRGARWKIYHPKKT